MIKLPNFKSIKYKFLFISLFLMLIFMLSTSSIWYNITSKNALESSSRYLGEMLQVSNEILDITLRDINYLVSATARNNASIVSVLERDISSYQSEYSRLEDDRKIINHLNSTFIYKTSIKGIMVANFNNRYFSSGDMPPLDIIQNCSWYSQLHTAHNQTIFTAPHTYTDTNGNLTDDEKVISIIRPILSSNQVIGFVLVDIKYSYFEKIYNSNLNGQTIILTIDTNTGEIIFTSQSDTMLAFTNDEMEFIKRNCTSHQGSFMGDINNQNSLIQYNSSKLTNWTSIGIITEKHLLSTYVSTQKLIIIYQIVLLIIGSIAIYFISHMMTKNILKLNIALKGFDKENLDVSVKIKSNDEIEDLANQFNKMVTRMKGLLLDIKKTETAKHKADLKVLQAQINPHFLYNTLNTISYLADLNHVDSIRDVSNSLTCLMNINMSNRQLIPIYSEIEYLKSYLYIQEYKYNHKFEYNLAMQETLGDLFIPKLLIQPLVENSLNHGIAPMKGPGLLLVQFYTDNNALKIRIQDNGIGMPNHILSKMENLNPNDFNHDHIGISNVKHRIQLYFGSDYGMTIFSEPNLYTIVELTIPLIHESEMNKYD